MLNKLVFLVLAQQALSQKGPASHITSNVATPDTPEFYELGQYNKTRTQFDGVTHDETVTFLQMTRDTGVTIPVMTTGTSNSTDFTIMFWFKFSQPTADQDIMQLFSFADSAACFMTKDFSIICDNGDRNKLTVSCKQLKPGLWFHLTLSMSKDGVSSYLLLQNNAEGVLAIDVTKSPFNFVQNVASGWQACLGDCFGSLGLVGGMREVVMRNSFVSQQNAALAKNMQFTYAPDFKAYFRFQNNGRFNSDEFIQRPWNSIKPSQAKAKLIGTDLIPNDVCPPSYEQQQYLKLASPKQFANQTVAPLQSENYAYFFSTTIQVTNTPCFTKNPTAAAMFCNIFLLDEVFMLYFESPNMLKVYFFAAKNYYESASKAFFVPYNQWVTIQLSLSRFNGFDLVLADQNGAIVYRQTSTGQNMQSMLPLNRISLFTNFEGYADHLLICTNQTSIGQTNVLIDKSRKDCIYNLGFSQKYVANKSVKNLGTNPALAINTSFSLDWVFYQGTTADANAGTFKASALFDGIACSDGHMTLKLNTSESFFRFTTPSFNMWQSESTVEFWFKLADKTFYITNGKYYIFSMRDAAGKQPYFEVFIQNGILICAPFGSASLNDLTLSFPQFSQQNEDKFGWWHVTCSYSFQKLARATLFNTNINTYQTVSLIGSSNFYPQDSLLASFGMPTRSSQGTNVNGLLIKEVRYWSSQLPLDQISLHRYSQIDPTLPQNTGNLLTYLRLASGTYNFQNFADQNLANQFASTNFTFSGIAFVPDGLQTMSYVYDVISARVVQQQATTYHMVCPLYSYFLNQFCYSRPINKLVLTVFPVWNVSSNALDWELSVLDSSAIDTSILMSLQTTWQISDSALASFFAQQKQVLDFVLPSHYLRHESEYQIQVSVANEQLTFNETQIISFVASRCHWFIVANSDAKSTYKVYGSPGLEDISFTLQLQSNSNLNCSDFNFFNQVDRLEFDFMLLNTNEFISVPPTLMYKLQPGGNIQIVLPSAEQQKLPLFTDIQMLVTLHWENSNLTTANNELIFQHVVITINFAPSDSELVANLIASATDVVQGETLILDATSSFISNVPDNISNRGISFQWQCPPFFALYCNAQTFGQLVIPWSLVVNISATNSVFQQPFTFTVVINWDKPNQDIVVDKVSAQVNFWNLTAPAFAVTYSPQPVLLSDSKNTIFSMVNANFDLSNLSTYTITWQLYPPLNDMNQAKILSGGAIYQVNKGEWSPDTSYTMTVTVTSKLLSKLTKQAQVQFATKSVPSGGSVLVSPQSAMIGQTITVSISGWSSENPPVVFNVYGTLDAGGLRRGLLLNVGAPVQGSDSFTFTLQNSNPVQVVISDQSQESIQFIQYIQVVTQPVDSSSQTPTQLLTQLRQSTDATQKVSLINQVLNQTSQPQQTVLLDTSSQILIRQSLLQAISNQISLYATSPNTQDMTVEDFTKKTIPLIQSASSDPNFLDTSTALQVESVVDQLSAAKLNVLSNLVQSDSTTRNSYIGILQNLNAAARSSGSKPVQTWVHNRTSSLMDSLCSNFQIDPGFKSANSNELAFEIFKFGQTQAMQNVKHSMTAVDARFELSAYKIFNAFPSAQQPQQLCAQMLSIQPLTSSGRLLAPSSASTYSSETSVQILDVAAQQHHQIGELSGQMVLQFALVPQTFRNNQTVCMGFDKTGRNWTSNLCQSELDISNVQMKCICNAFKSDSTGLFTDFTRPLNQTSIAFPAIKQSTRDSNTVNVKMKTRSHIWLITMCVCSGLLLICSAVAFRLDIRDRQKQLKRASQPVHMEVSFGSASSGMNHFVLEVSRELHQPYAEVEFRRQKLANYRNICPQSVFVHCLAQMHPLVSPFISHFATQSRLMRFSAYMLQIQIFMAVVCIHFGKTYRLNSIHYDNSAIDQIDIRNIAIASAVGSLALLPILSETLCTLLSNVVQRVVSSEANYIDEIQVEVKSRRKIPRNIMIGLLLVVQVIFPIWAGFKSEGTPTSNQICILMTIVGGIICSTFVTSVLYVGYSSFVAQTLTGNKCGRLSVSNWLVCNKALQIAQDMRAVQEASRLFTLADVLPSSLENSATIMRKNTEPERESEGEEGNPTNRGKYSDDQNLSQPQPEDSMQFMGSKTHQVRSRKAQMLIANKEFSENDSYDQNDQKVRQNNYMRVHGRSQSEDSFKGVEESHTSSVACNEHEKRELESSSAEYIDPASNLRDEISYQISQNISYSRPDISRNEILPVRGIGSESSAQSDFSDIRGSSESSYQNEVKISPQKKPAKRI